VNLSRLATVLLRLASASSSLMRRPIPAAHLTLGPMTSSAWEGWWHEDLAEG
jgi:hypothetical protein